MVAATVWFLHWLEITPPFPRPLGIAVTSFFALLALLMVSTIPYPSIKAVKLEGRRGYSALVALIVFLVVVLLNHEPMLFGLGILYVLSGPVVWWLERQRAKSVPTVLQSDLETESSGDVR
jgi:CDP-diacylglycerol--serine O-phosphatidyltransferase